MDSEVMEFRIKKWIAILEEQASSGLSKREWCNVNGIEKTAFFRWQRRVRAYLLEQGDDNNRLLFSSANNNPGDHGCFVELSQSRNTRKAILRECPEDASREAHAMCVFYGGFSVHVSGAVDEGQLAAVLRAMKYAD